MASVLFNILLILLTPLFTTAQTNKNITPGSSLTADERNSSWLSPSGEFAFGFREIGTEAYLLAIWFEKIVEKTIVWSANRDNLVPKGSTVQLTAGGQLVLADPNGANIWARPNDTSAAYAAMLDTENFILASQDYVNLWETFNEPTDTILPTQKLNKTGYWVVARYSETNYSKGRFHYRLQTDGNLIFSAGTLDPTDTYWYSDTQFTGFQMVFNQSGQIFVTAMNGTVLKSITASSLPADGFYQRAIIEYDGVFRQYVHPKNASSSVGWPMSWSTLSSPVPDNICQNVNQTMGSGACGFNSYCLLGVPDQRPQCRCPHGYTWIDPENEMNGCKQSFLPQSCDRSTPEADLFDLYEMPDADWPQHDYEKHQAPDEGWCRQACLVDCFCAVAIFRDGQCSKKALPLSNGRFIQGAGGKAFIKERRDNSTSKFPGDGRKKNDKSTIITVGSALVSSSFVLNLVLLLVTYQTRRTFQKRKDKLPQPSKISQATGTHRFTYQELEEATDGFKEELGRGAFGVVYKGALVSHDASLVAVKVLNEMKAEGEEEFKREMNTISQTNHKNLVKLLGFCNEGQHRLLVYEFMSNGSLADFLFGSSRPSWYERVGIASGVARGLSYLHDECTRQIIHCDIKPQNILLDGSLSAKISDFGLAKLLMTGQTRTMTAIRGTKGYLAPEWFRNMPISGKVDVYSFGILLLELICCRKSYEPGVEDEAQIVLADWVCDCYRDGNIHLLVENDEEALSYRKKVERFVRIAIWCIQEEPSLRPTMKKVIQMLEGAVDIPVPPLPYSFISSV